MATKQQIRVLAARLVEFQEEFSFLSNEDAQWGIMHGKKAAALCAWAIANGSQEIKLTKKSKFAITRLISGEEEIMIEEFNEDALASSIESTLIHKAFKSSGLDSVRSATAETFLDVSEVINQGTVSQIFTSISSDLDKLVMTEFQITRFCEKHPAYVRQKGYTTLFLTKFNYDYFVVHVYMTWFGLRASVWPIEMDDIFCGKDNLNVIHPRLISLVK